ncbi:unnamed protein product [Aphis gossypii]|uniref:Uncharacterized protein n=1 Tax=Aphis gossypii TaxID=80765 RepID=A0A9P0JDW4_APHGO|nr:unnamed protein product [Aphis gossypii]
MDGKLPRASPYDNDFHRRINELKRKLRPFHNKHTIEYLNQIAKSSRPPTNIDSDEQESSESARQDIQRRVQNLVKSIVSRQVPPECECRLPKLDMLAEQLSKMVNHPDFIKPATEDNKMNHTNVNSSAIINCNKVSGSKTESTEIVSKELKNVQL